MAVKDARLNSEFQQAMAVKYALNSEFKDFQDAEIAFLDDQAKAFNNEGSSGFKWYKQGPAAEHEFKREELDRAVSRATLVPERIATTAADMITNAERAYRSRYSIGRLDMFVRGRVRQDQLKLAGQLFRDQLDEERV